MSRQKLSLLSQGWFSQSEENCLDKFFDWGKQQTYFNIKHSCYSYKINSSYIYLTSFHSPVVGSIQPNLGSKPFLWIAARLSTLAYTSTKGNKNRIFWNDSYRSTNAFVYEGIVKNNADDLFVGDEPDLLWVQS